MSINKPSLPKGTRDFGPKIMGRRNLIFDQIRSTFTKFGFQPLETPSMENLSVLTGKYGDEGDQLIFKILNSGNFLEKVVDADIDLGYKPMTRKISEKALRYDLTVPFARYVVMNKGQLTFPFKRYQIQPVWRADRPQKGRYREFYQCDADVVGSDSLLHEVDIILMINEVLKNLGIEDFDILINNRKILSGICEAIGFVGREKEVAEYLDSVDKLGPEELFGNHSDSYLGLTPLNRFTILSIVKSLSNIDLNITSIIATTRRNMLRYGETIKGTFDLHSEDLNAFIENFNTDLLHNILDNDLFKQGISETRQIYNYLGSYLGQEIGREIGYEIETKFNLKLDLSLARGLSYYTGTIFEVKVNNVQIGSISGGGRYDNLTGLFGLPGVSGVGFSFGVDRIYDVMDELNLFQNLDKPSVQVMIANFGAATLPQCLQALKQLRDAGIASELYPEEAKMKKQFSYADEKKIPHVIIIGSEEAEKGVAKLKNMVTGEQVEMGIEEIVGKLK